MGATGVKSTDALFKSEKTSVDRGTFHATLPVVTLAVCSSLRSGQIDQQQLALRFALLVLDFDNQDGVGAGRCVVGGR